MSDLVSVPAVDLAAVMPFRAHEDVRYYLDGILIEPCATGGCMIVATEGHMLGAIHSPEARSDTSRILRITEGLEEALKQRAALNDGVVSVADEKGRVTLTVRGVESYIAPGPPFIDGKYPEWRKVIPPMEHIKPGTPSALQSRYLAKLWKTSREEQYSGVFFSHDGRNPETGAAVVQSVKAPNLIVLIMSMKFDRPAWPEWMPKKPPQPKEDAA